MFAAAKGIVVTFILFAGAFALHVVGGATDQGWLFAIAVGFIYVVATGYSGFALLIAGLARSGSRIASLTDLIGGVIGSALTIGALWASNGRAFEAWHFIAGPLLESAVSGLVVFIAIRLAPGQPRTRPATS